MRPGRHIVAPQPSVCDANDGQCYSTPVDDGTACNDGDEATESDSCAAGVCLGVDRCLGVSCPAQTCATGTCNLGTCEYTEDADGASCDDGFTDTVNDACSNGVCLGSNPCNGVECIPSSQCVLSSCGVVEDPPGTFVSSCIESDRNDGSTCEDALGVVGLFPAVAARGVTQSRQGLQRVEHVGRFSATLYQYSTVMVVRDCHCRFDLRHLPTHIFLRPLATSRSLPIRALPAFAQVSRSHPKSILAISSRICPFRTALRLR